MLEIYENTKIYIECPSSVETGGTEALHILALELRKMGVNAYMYYRLGGGRIISDKYDPVGKRFKDFNIPYVFEIDDEPYNILVLPETSESMLYLFKKIRKVFWWLSVDNYYKTKPKKGFQFIIDIIRKKRGRNIDFKDDSILHLAQSYYAMDFLNKKKVKNKAFLMDYLRDDFFNIRADFSSKNRDNIVLYNPAKGYEFTEKIIKSMNDVNFVPIKNMTPQEVIDLCLKSKIYIDFGEHPGKDRFPRETAILGNIVITGKKGSANFYEDIPIPDNYKFNQNEENILSLIDSKIKDCLINYDERINDFEQYRLFIKKDKEKFISDIKSIFIIPNSQGESKNVTARSTLM